MYDDVLVPLTASEDIGDMPIDLAEDMGATLHAVYLIRSVPMHDEEFWDQLVRAYKEDGKERLSELRGECLERGIDLESQTREGNPAEEILNYVEESDVDAVVMPRSCQGPLRDFVLGSITKKVVENAEVPVLSYRT